jgi:hypothetical protein
MKVPLGDDVSHEIETWCDVLVVVKVLGLVCMEMVMSWREMRLWGRDGS